MTPELDPKKNVAVLVSGRGSNLAALIAAVKSGALRHAHLAVVISNNPDAPALAYAHEQGIATAVVDHRNYRGDRPGHDAAIVECLRSHQVEWVVLAGYMRLITPVLLGAFPHRIINIHPSLLPAFPGVDGVRQAWEYGVKVSGCTVHFVEEAMDAGPIIYQATVPVMAEDSLGALASRILDQEHRALPFVVDLATSNRLRVDGRTVHIMPGESAFHELERSVRSYLPVVIASGNMHKVREIRAILAEMRLSFLSTRPFQPAPEPEENADTFLGNAKIKARAWRDITGLWALADDSGLVIDALNGRPGLQSARYAPTNEERIARVLGEMEGVPEARRTARFVCTCVLAGPNGEEFHAEGVCEGVIATEPMGKGGFGYDPIFRPEGFQGVSMAELRDATKNNVSHRARALYGLKPFLERIARK